MSMEIVAQIKADGKQPFTAGIVLRDDVVVDAAPIVKYMKGWKRSSVRSYVAERGWAIKVVTKLESRKNEE